MTPSEQLRLATAVGHTVPGAELRLRTRAGKRLGVSRYPSADLDVCALRNVVIAGTRSPCADLAGQISEIEIGGTITDAGGGIFASSLDRREQRWVATFAPPHRVVELLADLGLEDAVPEEAMHASVKPDTELGVTVVAITATGGRSPQFLDEVAATVAATFLVDELSSDLCADTVSDLAARHIGGAS